MPTAYKVPRFWKAFSAVLGYDSKDYWVIVVYSTALGVLSLAVPIAVAHLVNTVTFIGLLQPIVILTVILLSVLIFAGLMHLLQIYTVEIFERRAYARCVEAMSGRLAHVFPKTGETRSELSNRFIEVLNLQKTISDLFVEGIGLILTTLVGLALLALYHPVFIAFSALLIGSVVLCFTFLRGDAIEVAALESKAKYRLFGWLQDISKSPELFQRHASRKFNMMKTNDTLGHYMDSRRKYFRVLFRQQIGLTVVYVIFSALMLGVGGWLVVTNQLSLGQLVAAEIILSGILGGLWKAKVKIEKFDDLWISFYKLTDLLDREGSDEGAKTYEKSHVSGAQDLSFSNVECMLNGERVALPNMQFSRGTKNLIVVQDPKKRAVFTLLMSLEIKTVRGAIEVGGVDIQDVAPESFWDLVHCLSSLQFFEGSVAENLQLFQKDRDISQVRKTLKLFDLNERVNLLNGGMDARLDVRGQDFSETELLYLCLAREHLADVKVLVIDDSIQQFNERNQEAVMKKLSQVDSPWTLIILSEAKFSEALFDQVISL